MKNEETKSRSMSSFCPNCGDVVRWETTLADRELNARPCGECARTIAEWVDADIREQIGEQEIGPAEIDQILAEAGIDRRGKPFTRKELSEAKRDKQAAAQKLRDRRAEIMRRHFLAVRSN